jgi:hypothetical protein
MWGSSPPTVKPQVSRGARVGRLGLEPRTYGLKERPAIVRRRPALCVSAGEERLQLRPRPEYAVVARRRGCHRGCQNTRPRVAQTTAPARTAEALSGSHSRYERASRASDVIRAAQRGSSLDFQDPHADHCQPVVVRNSRVLPPFLSCGALVVTTRHHRMDTAFGGCNACVQTAERPATRMARPAVSAARRGCAARGPLPFRARVGRRSVVRHIQLCVGVPWRGRRPLCHVELPLWEYADDPHVAVGDVVPLGTVRGDDAPNLWVPDRVVWLGEPTRHERSFVSNRAANIENAHDPAPDGRIPSSGGRAELHDRGCLGHR